MGGSIEAEGNKRPRTGCWSGCSACALRARCLALLCRLQALSPACPLRGPLLDDEGMPRVGDSSGTRLDKAPGLGARSAGQGGKVSAEAARRLSKLIHGEAKSLPPLCCPTSSQGPEARAPQQGPPLSEKRAHCSNLPHLEALVAALESPLLTSSAAVLTRVGPTAGADSAATERRRQHQSQGQIQELSHSESEGQEPRSCESDRHTHEVRASVGPRQCQTNPPGALSGPKIDVIGVAGGGTPVWVCLAPNSAYAPGCRPLVTGACWARACAAEYEAECAEECTSVFGSRVESGNREGGKQWGPRWERPCRTRSDTTADCGTSMHCDCKTNHEEEGSWGNPRGGDSTQCTADGGAYDFPPGVVQKGRCTRGLRCGACRFIHRLREVLELARSLHRQPPSSSGLGISGTSAQSASNYHGSYDSASNGIMSMHRSSVGIPRAILVVLPQSEGKAESGWESLKRRLETELGATAVGTTDPAPTCGPVGTSHQAAAANGGQEDPQLAPARGAEERTEAQSPGHWDSDSDDIVIVLNEQARGKSAREGEAMEGGARREGEEDAEHENEVEQEHPGVSLNASFSGSSRKAAPLWFAIPVSGLAPAGFRNKRLEQHRPSDGPCALPVTLHQMGLTGTRVGRGQSGAAPVAAAATEAVAGTVHPAAVTEALPSCVAAGAREAAPGPLASPRGPPRCLGWGLPLLNLDVTALVALTSQLSHGGAKDIMGLSQAQLASRFRTTAQFMRQQAEAELESPLLPQLARLAQGRRLIACASAVRHFEGIVSTVGGPQEQHRAGQILGQIKRCSQQPCTEEGDESLDEVSNVLGLGGQIEVSPDLPCVELQEVLPPSRRIKPLNVTVFSHGSALLCPTLTSNTAFLRAAQQAGAIVAALVHRPCALMGV